MKKTALYLRLSREDDEKNGDSQSIANQKTFLTEYAQKAGFSPIIYFIDDGWSGTSFDRPAFQKMLRAIEAGQIDKVITKDLSRLGRDYIQTGYYLERFFPEHRIRYIAVNDRIDIGSREDYNDFTPFLSVMNDFYAKDISKKVRTTLDTKKRKGEFIGSMPPYGYIRDPDKKNKLRPYPPTAQIVQQIFRLFQGGTSLLGIANHLTMYEIPTPSGKSVWNDMTVRRILTNRAYIGCLVQSKCKKINYKVHKKMNLPPEEWIVTENAHTPLVTQEVFLQVQTLLRNRGYHRGKSQSYPFSGLARCADCGSKMTFSKQAGHVYFVCTLSRRAVENRCTPHTMRMDFLQEGLQTYFSKICACFPDLRETLQSNASKNNMLARREIETAISGKKTAMAQLYQDKVEGILNLDEYLELKDIFTQERQRLEVQYNALTQREMAHNAAITEQIEHFLLFQDWTREQIMQLIEKIDIHSGQVVDIHLRFRDIYSY